MSDQPTTERDHTFGTAYGNDPAVHRIEGGRFVCLAAEDAKCRSNPTCECENWCCCDGSPQDSADNHDEGEHCCMTTAEAGRPCWIEPWVDAVGVEDTYDDNAMRFYDADDEPVYPDGPVACDWEDGIRWRYALVGADLANLVTWPGSSDGGDR